MAPCGSGGSNELTVTAHLGPAPAGGHLARLNGVNVVEYGSKGVRAGRVVVPSLDAELVAHTAAAARIISTLQPSLGYDFVHGHLGTGWPSSWQTVSFRGVTLDTPRSWKVQRVGYLPCDALGQDFPAVLRGTIDSVSGCAGYPYLAVPTTHGAAWIDPGTTRHFTILGTVARFHQEGVSLHLAVIADTPAQVLVTVSGAVHGTIVVAIPPAASTSAAVVDSLR